MVRMFVRHNVADYEVWRKGYDEFDQERGPNDVTAWHDSDTAEAARAFVSSDALRSAMQRAGVQGEPQIWFVTAS